MINLFSKTNDFYKKEIHIFSKTADFIKNDKFT